jgi:hypothetical protein
MAGRAPPPPPTPDRWAFRAEGGIDVALPSVWGVMARKRDDVFIIGTESAPAPGDGVAAGGAPPQGEARNAFAPAPPQDDKGSRAVVRLRPGRRLGVAAGALALAAALAALALGRGDGTGARSPDRPPASDPLVEAPAPRPARSSEAAEPSRPPQAKRARRPSPARRRSRPRRRSLHRRHAGRHAAAEPQASEAAQTPPPPAVAPPMPPASPPPPATPPSPASAVAQGRPEFSFER